MTPPPPEPSTATKPPLIAQTTGVLAALGGTPRVLFLVWGAHPPIATAVLALTVFQGLSPLALAWLTKLVIDVVASAITGPGNPMASASTVTALLLMRATYQSLSSASTAPARYLWLQLTDHTTRRLERLILAKAISLKGIAFFESPRFFDLLQRVQNQAMNRPINIINNLTAIVRSFLGLATMTVAFALFSPWLTALILFATLPHLVGQFRNRRESFQINSWSHPEVRTMHYMTSLLTHRNDVKEVRLFGLGDFFLQRYRDTFESFRRRLSGMRLRHWYTTLGLSTLSAGAHALAFAAVIFAAVEGRITLGDFLFYTTALTQIESGMNGIIRVSAALYESILYVGTFFELLDVRDTLPIPPTGTARLVAAPLRQGVELRHVGFSYPGREKPVLEDVSFTIAPGRVVALVGENGAGKTTIVKLVTRLYDPTGGQVLVDGVDLREHDLDDWRRQSAAIFQDFSRFHFTARENVGIGDVTCLDDEPAIRAAAGRGGAAAVIDKLPGGYDTVLGLWLFNADVVKVEEGTELSGGEWQKVALSRGFMRTPETDPPRRDHGAHHAYAGAQLLILDEPTASLDTQSEYDVYLRFHELTKGKATLLISHRFSTVRMADRIVVLEEGRIKEQGTHEELVRAGGTYADLYEKQASRYR